MYRIFLLILWGFILTVVTAQETLYIAYTANLNANLEPCRCGPNELGSMIQLSSAVDTLRNRYGNLLLMDSGDFFKTYPLYPSNLLICDFLNMMQFDAVALGDQEFVEGFHFLEKILVVYPLPVISANMRFNNTPGFELKRYIMREAGSLRVGITSVIHPGSFDYIAVRELDILPVMESLRQVLAEISAETDILVLLYHAGYKDAITLAQEFPVIDIVIAGHSQEQAVYQTENQLIVQPGYDGEYLGLIEIRVDENRRDFKNIFIPVTSSFRENPVFVKKISEYNRTMEDSLH